MASTTRSPSHRFLPPDPRVAEPYRLTPQVAFRLAVLGMILLAVFAVLFLRLWALQILSGPQYLQAAQNNQLRTIRLQAPRGPILDRNGNVLVGNTVGHSVQIWPADLPEKGRYQMLKRLSQILNVPVGEMAQEIAKRKDDPLSPVTVKRDVRKDKVIYIGEHEDELPGVAVVKTWLRTYPHDTLAAQILGHVGEVTEDQVEANPTFWPGDEIGQGGVESSFDGYLRGSPGIARMRVDSLGRPRSSIVPAQLAQAGNAIRLTLDAKLQQAAEESLRFGIALAHQNEEWYADGGAVVALDPRDGQILALASDPTFQPSLYVGHASRQELAPLTDDKVAASENFPALNRAVAGLYPPGSTFKPVTALAAIQEGIVSPWQTLSCTGSYQSPHDEGPVKQTFRNWDPYVNKGMALSTALSESCDTYFYQLGDAFFGLPPERGHPLQGWASRFGFGQRTGVDVGPELEGLLPTPEWRDKTFTRKTDPCCWQVDRLWKPGDSVQLAIGQKDLLVTPLQMARFFALVANGGRLVTPYLVASAEQPGQNGAPSRTLQRFAPVPPQQIPLDGQGLEAVRDGLYRATHDPYGTSSRTFGAYPIPIAGKTGTAEKYSSEVGRMLDQSWWCGYGPSANPELVVCVVIENGGHGSSAAAPAALKVFERYFGIASEGPIQYTESD
ncbi:MAG: penicillin-binding protein 2 [Gaiellaceae bacterium]